jgi:hypothetical protein
MKELGTRIGYLLGLGMNDRAAAALDYEQAVHLDAEELAEGGIKAAYDSLRPRLEGYVGQPAELTEHLDRDAGSYSVSCAGIRYQIYSPISEGEENAWGNAAYALFSCVNAQLKDAPVKLYALNGGNNLFGIFLTEQQVAATRRDVKRKMDWPYLPTREYPWYGMHHA